MRIYLDNCCYNRPFDDQNDRKVYLETIAKLQIQQEIRDGVHELVWSFMNDLENGENPYDEARNAIQMWERRAVCICKTDLSILQRGKFIEQSGIKAKDALHIACAIVSGCDYFITTDGGLTNKAVAGITIMNPARFITEETDEN